MMLTVMPDYSLPSKKIHLQIPHYGVHLPLEVRIEHGAQPLRERESHCSRWTWFPCWLMMPRSFVRSRKRNEYLYLAIC